VLRRLGAGIALWALLAGCSGAVTPSARDRSICTTVRKASAGLALGARPVSSFMESESKDLLHSSRPASSVVVFVTAGFTEELVRSGDATFQRVGHLLQHSGDQALVTQLGARCTTLGL
jgi:hypothetical protein